MPDFLDDGSVLDLLVYPTGELQRGNEKDIEQDRRQGERVVASELVFRSRHHTRLTLFSGVCEAPDHISYSGGLSCSPADRLAETGGRQGICMCSSSDEADQNLSRCW